MGDITDADCMHAKIVCKDFEKRKKGGGGRGYYYLYLKNDISLLADIFENLRKMRLKIYHLDSVKFP